LDEEVEGPVASALERATLESNPGTAASNVGPVTVVVVVGSFAVGAQATHLRSLGQTASVLRILKVCAISVLPRS
jgi:hypothetical protein